MWEHDEISIKPVPKIDTEVKPFTKEVKEMVTIEVPYQEPLKVEVSTWEKIWWLWNQYKDYLDILIKLTPIIIAILGLIKKLNMRNRNA